MFFAKIFFKKKPKTLFKENKLFNILYLYDHQRGLASLLEDILESKPSLDWLEEMFLPKFEEKGIARIARAVTELENRRNILKKGRK